MKSLFLLPNSKIICWWYLWGANYYLSLVFIRLQLLQYLGARYNTEISIDVIEHGLCSSHPSAWPIWLECFSLSSPSCFFSYLWGIWEKVSFVVCYETTLACEPTQVVPGACGSILEHIVLLALTLAGDPRHRCCDGRHREQSLQQPGSAFPVACALAADELFCIGCFPKPSKLWQPGELKSNQVLLPSLYTVTEAVMVREHGKIWTLWTRSCLEASREPLEPGCH